MDNKEIYDKLLEKIDKNKILLDEPMKNHTSFKVGGPADFYIKIDSIQDLKYILNFTQTNKIPFIVIGNGTNLLVKDAGIRGIVAKLDLQEITVQEIEDGIIIKAGCSASLITVAKIALKYSCTGLEFSYGIPASIGGAVRMNAGAFNGEIKSVVLSSTYMDKNGNIHKINNEEHKFDYRNSVFSNTQNIILETEFKLKKGNYEAIENRMNEVFNIRKDKQPTNKHSAGSTFKRGTDFITAKLIDDSGLKGIKVGDAEVSTKHAGFIINNGNATAKDILELMKIVEETVYKNFGKKIEPEVLVLGEDK